MTRKSPIRHLTAGVLLPLALATALLAGGCGFQPRGQIDGSLPSPLHIAGLSPYSTLHRECPRTARYSIPNPLSSTGTVLLVVKWMS